jgi:hypothetical protein
VLAEDLIDGPLVLGILKGQVVTTRTVLRFNNDESLSEPEDNIGLDTAGEPRPEPALLTNRRGGPMLWSSRECRRRWM